MTAAVEITGSGMTQSENSIQGYLDLLAAIIRSGIQDEGVEYLRTPDGQAMCWAGGLDPEVVRSYAQREARGKQTASGAAAFRHIHHDPALKRKKTRWGAVGDSNRRRPMRQGQTMTHPGSIALAEKEGTR
jgi:hypothetical protein